MLVGQVRHGQEELVFLELQEGLHDLEAEEDRFGLVEQGDHHDLEVQKGHQDLWADLLTLQEDPETVWTATESEFPQ